MVNTALLTAARWNIFKGKSIEQKRLMATGRNDFSAVHLSRRRQSMSVIHPVEIWTLPYTEPGQPVIKTETNIFALFAFHILLHVFNRWEQYKQSRNLQIIYFLHMCLNICVELASRFEKLFAQPHLCHVYTPHLILSENWRGREIAWRLSLVMVWPFIGLHWWRYGQLL